MRPGAPLSAWFCGLCLVWAGAAFCGLPGVQTLGIEAHAVAAGEVWRLGTYALVHGAWWHLAANVIGIWMTGRWLERQVGSRTVAAVGLLGIASGALGFLVTLAVDPRLAPGMRCVGASGVLSALLGFVTGHWPRERLRVYLLGLPLTLQGIWLGSILVLLMALEATLWPQRTAYGAHLGAGALGVLLGAITDDR
ncbi:MAG: rhomboid family intramembrane serine protease [Candidatus Spyradenecus sp.]